MKSRIGGWIVGLSVLCIFGGLAAALLLGLRDVDLQPTPAAPQGEKSVVVKAAPPAATNFGYVPNPQGTKDFLSTLPKPLLRDAAPDLFQGDSECFLYRGMVEAYQKTYGEKWVVVAQGIGDCVSHGWANGIAVAIGVEWKLGNVSEFKYPASEAVYGLARVEGIGRSTGGWSDGAYGGGAAKGVSKFGVLFRQPYEKFDLSKYSSSRAKEWGHYGCGGKGDNGWADGVCKEHPVKSVALVRSFDEAAAAIRSGYPVPVCSGQGFTSRRDSEGFCAPSGSWSHCMVFIAVRMDRPGLLCLNSWGPNAQSGPKYPDDQPDGSFWVDAKVATRMLAGEDSFAVSAVEGFPFRPLDNGDWVNLTPRREVGQDNNQFALAP